MISIAAAWRASGVIVGLALVMVGLAALAPSEAQAQYRETIRNDMRQCAPGSGPAVRVTVRGIKSSTGTVRLQSYRATKADWLAKGKWINRIELPARKGSMTFCLPIPGPGDYAIAARHDANDNRQTDVTADGGAMSNNPSINIFNLGRPGVDKTRFTIGDGVERMSITMLYFG
ncbi:MAG: DUF2141 domain-containing protein [Pseudomonadota bacterium]